MGIEDAAITDVAVGDTLQLPGTDKWITVSRTARGQQTTTRVYSQGETTTIEEYPVLYDEAGEEHRLPGVGRVNRKTA